MNLMQKMPSEEQKNIYCQIHNRKTKIKITKIKITQIKITQIKIINQKQILFNSQNYQKNHKKNQFNNRIEETFRKY